MKKNFRHHRLYLVPFALLSFAVMMMFFSTQLCVSHQSPKEGDLRKCSKNITKTIEKFKSQALEISNDVAAAGTFSSFNTYSFQDKAEGLNDIEAAVFVYKKDSLLAYSDYKTSIEERLLKNCGNSPSLINGHNGLYYIEPIKKGELSFVFVLLMQRQYAFENEFLINAINPCLCSNESWGFSLSNNETEQSVFSCRGKYVNLVAKEDYSPKNVSSQALSLFLFIAGMLLIAYCLYRFVRVALKPRNYSLWRLLITFLLYIISWQLGLWMIKNYFIEHSMYFSPDLFALSTMFPGLGVLIFHLIWSVSFALVLLRELKIYPIQQRLSRKKYQLLFVMAMFFSMLSMRFVIINLPGIIYNTSIRIDFTDIFSFGWPHVFLFFSLFLTFSLAFIFILSSIMMALKLKIKWKNYSIYFTISALAIVFLYPENLLWDGIISIASVLCLLTAFIYFLSNRNTLFLTLFIISGAVLTSLTINQTNAKKIIENQAILAVSLSGDQDPLSEDLFKDAAVRMNTDPLLDAMLSGKNNDEVLASYIENHYLNGYLSRYQLRVIRCSGDEQMIVKPENKSVECVDFFEDLAHTRGIPTISEDLYYIDDNNGTGHYLYLFPRRDSLASSMFLELIPISAFREQGYPELLVDKNLSTKKIPLGYSYARYFNGELINSYGNYKFRLRSDRFLDTLRLNGSIHKDDYVFYKSGINNGFYLVLATQAPGFWALIAPFPLLSLLFLFLSFLLLYFSGNRRRFGMGKTTAYAFKLRLLVISTLILALLIAAVFSIVYFYRLNNTKNEQALYEKAYSLNIELERKLSSDSTLSLRDETMLYELLIKFSSVFFVDINIYDTEGQLITSSRNAIFDKHLISTRMNPSAFEAMSREHQMYFSTTENIGTMTFNAAYLPIRNSSNEIIAYMGLPIFAKTSELNREISSFITTFINIYILLTLITIAISVFFAEYITRPLRFISEKLRNIKLGVANEKIDWKRSDEIGNLVAEYNRMIDELAEKAEILARSERESAWKEMARQVAHEIKNPLTPMKLSVQYLDRAWKEGRGDFQDRLSRFTQTMVEQIDNLANIANEFSNFSRMPELEQKLLCVNDVLGGVVTLFRHEEYDIITEMPSEALFLKADESRLIRIFTNVIKNATQSFRADVRGQIVIKLDKADALLKIEIADNGVGISEEFKSKIFQPNFTTKSSGTGLGLAMVKNMVESMNGTIQFDSVLGEGTKFEIVFNTQE